jgi:subtilisin family serine protease
LGAVSDWGSPVELAAPGGCILSTLPGGEYGVFSGTWTSMATPHVSAAAAFLASKSNPNSRADVEKIRQELVDGASLTLNDTSEDGEPEPVVYLGGTPITATEVATGGISNTDRTTATLSGAINSRGLETEYQFEYGITTEYTQKAPVYPGKIKAGTKYTTVSQKISGLMPEQPKTAAEPSTAPTVPLRRRHGQS